MDPLKLSAGLFPNTLILVGDGYNREDLKKVLFTKNLSLSDRGLKSVNDFCMSFLSHDAKLLKKTQLQRLFKKFIISKEIQDKLTQSYFKELTHQKISRIYFSLEVGRHEFLHEEEAFVYKSRLKELNVDHECFDDYYRLSLLWDHFLGQLKYLDSAKLLKDSFEKIKNKKLNYDKIILFNNKLLSPVEQQWISTLKDQVSEFEHNPSYLINSSEDKKRYVYSSIDDASIALSRMLSNLENELISIVIDDRPVMRRSLRTALLNSQIITDDIRDPLEFRVNESIKKFLVMITLINKRYDLDSAIEWSYFRKMKLINEIIDLGIIGGNINEWSKDKELSQLYSDFLIINEIFSYDKYTYQTVLSCIEKALKSFSFGNEGSVIIHNIINQWYEELNEVGDLDNEVQLMEWQEEFVERVEQQSPFVLPISWNSHVRVFRLSQAPNIFHDQKQKIIFFGIQPQQDFELPDSGDWFRRCDLELLEFDFSVSGKKALQEHRQSIFQAWEKSADELITINFPNFYGNQANPNYLNIGKDRVTQMLPDIRFGISSYSSKKDVFLNYESKNLSVSQIDRYSYCPFTSLVYDVWRAKTVNSIEFELRGSVRGKLLHSAIETLLEENCSTIEALERAWRTLNKRGLFKSSLLIEVEKIKVLKLLEAFRVAQSDYQKRSNTRLLHQELDLSFTISGYKVVGRLDRVDEHRDGLVIIDYKTGSSQPTASDVIKFNHGLQLPLYVMGLKLLFDKEIIGAQFWILGETVDRSKGILFDQWNSQNEYSLSSVTQRSGSLVKDSPEAFWNQCFELIRYKVDAIGGGEFSASPSKEQNCYKCKLKEACSLRRREAELAL